MNASTTRHRALLLNGGVLLVRHLAAVLWAFCLSLVLTALLSLHQHHQFAAILDHSLAREPLTHGFDLGSAIAVLIHASGDLPVSSLFGLGSVPAFALLYLLLIPGTLACYLTGAPVRLSTLLRDGLLYLWRFVLIAVLALIAFLLILGPLSLVNAGWTRLIDEHIVGRPAFLLELLSVFVLFLVATLIRLFFDLMEVYTVQLGLAVGTSAQSYRGLRPAFLAAWRGLRLHLGRLWGSFLLLALLGAAGYTLLARTALHTLAQPRVWPLLLFSELAILLSMITRFWQRAIEVTFAHDHPVTLLTTVPSAVAPNIPPGDPVPSQRPSPDPHRDDSPEDLPDKLPIPPRPGTGFAAPMQTAYDIDPFTPLTMAPNPISTEEEESLRDKSKDRNPPSGRPESTRTEPPAK